MEDPGRARRRAIREVDPDHPLFVERVNSVGDQWKEDENRNFFRIADPNMVYEFHFYKPFHFTHQGAPGSNSRPRTPAIRTPPWPRWSGSSSSPVAHAEGPKLPAGDSGWTFYPGPVFTARDPAIVVGKPVLTAQRLGAGRAFFDDLVLEEVDAQGSPKRAIRHHNPRSRRGWYFWKADGSGSFDVAGPAGTTTRTALAVTGTRGDANLGADALRFRTEPGASYRLSGWMRGEHVPADATARIDLELLASSVPVQARDKAFVAQELDAYLAWGKKQQVPLFLGEWGAIRQSFDCDRGGVRWAGDMLDLLVKSGVSFTYHAYHEDSFGLFRGEGALPDPGNANKALLDLFRARLHGR